MRDTMDRPDSLALLLFEGVTSPSPFAEFLKVLAVEVDAESATILIERQRRDCVGAIFSSNISPARSQSYRAAYEDDPFVDLVPGRAITLAEHLSATPPMMSPFVQRFMIPHGVFHVLGMDVVAPDGTRVRLRATRRLGKEDFGRREKTLFVQLDGALRKAIDLFLRLNAVEAEREAFAGVLTRMAVGAMLVTSRGVLLRATDGARQMLDRGDPLKIAAGRLAVSQGGSRHCELVEAIARMSERETSAGSVHAMLLDRREAGVVSVLIRSAAFAGQLSAPLRGSALVLVSDTGTGSAPPSAVLSQLFGFTPSEAELAALLGQGMSLDEATLHLGISKNTSKAHLRAIFLKSGATRQSTLVRLLLRCVDELR